MNLGNLLRQTAQLFPHHTGLIHAERRVPWFELERRVNAMANALRALGVCKGERILVQSRNNQQMFESCWATFRLGCVWVPTNFRLTPSEVAYLAVSSGASVMIAEAHFANHVRIVCEQSQAIRHVITIAPESTKENSEVGIKLDTKVGTKAQAHDYEDLVAAHLDDAVLNAAVRYDDPLWFFYTSGTTGKPKAAILTHGQMAFVVNNHLADLIPGTSETDCSIAVAPLSHGAGIHALLNVAKGAATVLMPGEKLDPELVWRFVEKYRVSNLFTVPTIVKLLVEHEAVDRYDHSSLRYLIYAGAPMYRSDQKRALEKLGKVLVQYFGLGEVTGCITVLPASMHSANDLDPEANIGSCGRPRTGMEVVILDDQLNPAALGEVGEICCRGLGVFAGYFGNEEATQKALRGGWFHTGDLGRLDARGLLYITGRESDMYISGGSNVYPREIEEILLTYPGVAEVAIVGMPDPKWGEVGVAVVVRKVIADGALTNLPDEAHLLAHLEGHCARYKWPQCIVFWDALPKSGYGKIVKKDIQSILSLQVDTNSPRY
jgi:fatty-acyl-CoA synthase